MRFQIRTLMLLVAAFATIFSIAETITRDSRIRHRIEGNLRSMGASQVVFDEANVPYRVRFIAPVGLDRIGSYESFENIEFVKTHVADGTIRSLLKLKHVGELHFNDCIFTDSQMMILANIGSVSTLQITGSQITDAVIPAIASIRSLKSLILSPDTLLTYAGFAELEKRRPDIAILVRKR